MLAISEHFPPTGMTTSGRSLWTILTVSVSLMCAYSVKLDCQEMEACTDKLRGMNHTISNRVGTSQMIKTCIQLTQNFPTCFEPAKKTCGLKFDDTIPYRLLYYNTKDSCNKGCPIFQPLLNCETKVAYVDLSTDKNKYCRSYIESMECLETTLVNITCSYGEQTSAYILDTVYDQSSRQFGDGVCMAAKDCTDVDNAVTSVKACLLQWNSTRDYSDSGTDALKSCVSKITTCSDALKMVPYFEESLIGIDVTARLTTETPETSSAVTTTTAPMTSSVRSPSSSTIDTSVRTSNATRPYIEDVLTKISRQPLETTTATTKGTTILPDPITTSFRHETSSSQMTTSSKPKTSSSPTKTFSNLTTSSSPMKTPTDTTKGISILSGPITTSVRHETSSSQMTTSSNFKTSSSSITTSFTEKTKSFQNDIFSNPKSSISPVTTSPSHQTSNSHFEITSQSIASTEKNDPPSNRGFVIPKVSATPSLKFTESSTGGDKDDSVTMETQSHSSVVEMESSTVLSSGPAFSAEDENEVTQDAVVNTSLFSAVVENEMTTPSSEQQTAKSDQNTVTAGLADRQSYSGNTPPRVNDGISEEVHEKVPSSVPEPTRVSTRPVKTSTVGREITRTLYSSGKSRIETTTSRLPLKSESVTRISTVKSDVPSTSLTSKTTTSLSKGAHSGDTNGGAILVRSRAIMWILVTLVSYFFT
ncbi:cell wall protein DAN4-like [Pecten maximus]|uniref:cell wall protein DAN4-like n=1 Tax=Pecten maximus TaxID=6579 RepID=UPI0014591818|nr:cell wall protein DAN4-like [Pecten maximus]